MPKGITSTGFPAVRDTCTQLGFTFDSWQTGSGMAILGKREDGLYAADAVVISIPRQVGKTFLVGAVVFALCIINPGLLVLWTAHRTPTANETFQSMRALAERPKLKAHITSATAPAGNGVIKFRNGSRILFGAREQGFGRGIPKVAVVVFDEAQILTQNAIDDMIPAMNRAVNPLVVYIGTPPKPSDRGDVFINLRSEALSGESDDTLYIEFSADEDADPNDREQWAKANPSYPVHTPARAMLRMKKNLGAESFMREALGIWDGNAQIGAFSSGSWARRVTAAAPGKPAAIGVACDVDQVWLSLGAVSSDEVPHLGAVHRERIEKRSWFVSEVARIQSENECLVAIDKRGPAGFLIEDLEAAGVDLLVASLDDFVQACADIRSAVELGRVTHGDYGDLNAAVDAAGWRTIGERRVFGRKNGDVSMLEAVALALWGAKHPGPAAPAPFFLT